MPSGRVVLNQPAGHLERGETFLEAVAREALEETGWTFVPEAVAGMYVWQPEHLTRTFLRVAFAAASKATTRPGRSTTASCAPAGWIATSSRPAARHRSPLVLRCVDDYLSGTRYPLELLSHLLPSRDEPRRMRRQRLADSDQ